MQRYFVTDQQPADDVQLTSAAEHHLVDVMRAAAGDQLEVVLADHQAYLAVITQLHPVVVHLLHPLDNHPELPVEVTIACGVPKTKDKPQLIVQKGTELGASRIIFFDCQRAVSHWNNSRQKKKIARLQKIANNAAEQSHRLVQPLVDYRDNWQEVVADFGGNVNLVAWEESAKHGETSRLKSILSNVRAGQKLLAFFGPEGGLSDEEVRQMERSGLQAVGLGPRILRTETAPLYFLSTVSYETELSRTIN